MNDVVIRKCTLRVVRHGGWSWGSRRGAILENATAALPRLIVERLAELLGDVEGEIAQPIRLRFALRAGQLASGEGLASVVASGIRSELLPLPARTTKETRTPRVTVEGNAVATRLPAVASRDDGFAVGLLPGPSQVLLQWRDQGVLWHRLQGFSLHALGLWLSALLSELPTASATASQSISQTLQRDCMAIQRCLPMRADDRGRALRARLAIAVELIARHGEAISSEAIVRSLDTVIPLTAIEPMPRGTHVVADAGPHAATKARDALLLAGEKPMRGARALHVPASFADGSVELCSVLPYLVLGVLHRLGWLDLASATLRALDLPDRGSVFATAFAYKLLPPPERGWHRTSAVLRTAAAFAGVPVPPSPLDLARWSHDAAGGLSPLDDFVASELARGHDCSLPLVIMRVDSHHDLPWLLFDADGCFPVAWQPDEDSLRNVVRRFGPCVLLVSAEAATPALMSGLVADHRSFVTSATPGRSDDWRRVKGTACWAGGMPMLSRRLIDAAGMLPELMAQALAVTRELLHLRPAAAPREAAELEHSAALGAATGLGSLAWTLWRDRETVHPLLALERFGNLDGVARSDGTVVEIHPAFGRRYLDLQRHGLLADIPAPPWIDARRIVFAGP